MLTGKKSGFQHRKILRKKLENLKTLRLKLRSRKKRPVTLIPGSAGKTIAAIPEAVIPAEAIPEAAILEAVIPEAVIPEAVIPEAVIPVAVIPEAVIPEEVIPEAENVIGKLQILFNQSNLVE